MNSSPASRCFHAASPFTMPPSGRGAPDTPRASRRRRFIFVASDTDPSLSVTTASYADRGTRPSKDWPLRHFFADTAGAWRFDTFTRFRVCVHRNKSMYTYTLAGNTNCRPICSGQVNCTNKSSAEPTLETSHAAKSIPIHLCCQRFLSWPSWHATCSCDKASSHTT